MYWLIGLAFLLIVIAYFRICLMADYSDLSKVANELDRLKTSLVECRDCRMVGFKGSMFAVRSFIAWRLGDGVVEYYCQAHKKPYSTKHIGSEPGQIYYYKDKCEVTEEGKCL